MKNKETGALAIETALSLTFFMISIIAIMFMAVIIKVQASMQYAISQTAKEISTYYYMVDKLGLATVVSAGHTASDDDIKALNQTIDNFSVLISDTQMTAGKIESLDSTELQLEDLSEIGGDLTNITNQATQIGQGLIDDIKTGGAKRQVIAVLKVFSKSLINRAFTELVTPYICKALMPKYLTSGNIEDYVSAAGLNWENQDYKAFDEYMTFRGSELLKDGRSIKIDVVYTINTKNLTFGLVDTKLKFHQCASTAAWVKPNGGSLKTLADVANSYEPAAEGEGEGEGEGP